MTEKITGNGLWILDPTTSPEPMQVEMVPRPDTLNGKIVGLLDNSKPNAGKLLTMIASLLAERYQLAGLVKKQKPNASQGAPSAILDELAEECQVAIVGVGD